MVFKSKFFFSLKKSKSSDSLNNPQSGGSNSPIGSDKKKSKSESKEESRSLSCTLGLKKKKKKKDGSSKGKVASSSNLSYSGHETPPPTSEVKEKPRTLASFLGLNRIKTRSNSLPHIGFFNLGNDNAIGTSSESASGSATIGSGTKKEGGSSSPALPVSETGQFKVSPSCSGPAGSSEVCTPEDLYELENLNEPESLRCQTLPRMTSAPIACGDIKSFSHELNSKGVRPFPLWKPHGLHSLEEILNLTRTKFDKEKEEVNSELVAFAWELVGFLESHHELQVQIEDLLLLSRKCAETTPGEFWGQCEDIVQNLDDRRQELSPGVLKQLHTRMLFILTRCTRLLLHKDSWEQEVVQLRQSRDLHFADKRVPTGEVRDMGVWKRFPSPASKGVKESAVSKEQNDSKVEPPKVVKHRVPTAAKPPKCPAKLSHEHMSKHHHNISEECSIICRICEEEVCITYVEDHSRICALAEKHDQKGVSVDERLVAVAVTLKKIIDKFIQKDSLAAVESSDGMKISNASLTKEYDVLSPKLSDWSRKGSEDMLDCFLEADNSDFMDDIRCLTLMSCMTCFGLKSDQGMTTSSAGSITPGGRGAFYEQDDIPQMSKLADIAIRAANVIPDGDHFTQLLLACLRDLRVVINHRKFDALTVETFGTRIEKFIWEKYLRLCNILGDEKVDLSSIDKDAPLEDDVVRSLRTSQVHPRNRISIDDFEILDKISSGAFGKVFMAKKRITGDIFAIKVLKKADIIRKNAVKSILAERDILISARNPFMVRFFYSFTCPKKLYLVMEYLNGGDFYSLLKKFGSLDESIARVYIAEIVLALEYLHSKGVVHHDLKPDNLLIACDGHVKLADFGLSKVGLVDSTNDLSGPVLRETSEHQLETVVGTPDYLAPEILSGTGQGAAVDWWSVGIILFELIAGRPPFNADNPQQIFENIRNCNIPWPRVPEEMSHEARDLIDRLLTEDPQQRLGARGAAEVKQHIFFKGINWDTQPEQEAAFVPDSTNAFDTSYFESRYSSNLSDTKCSSDCDSLSERQNEGVDERDEFAEFEMYEDYSFSTFSLKNLFELAYLTLEALSKFYKCIPRPRSYRRRQTK